MKKFLFSLLFLTFMNASMYSNESESFYESEGFYDLEGFYASGFGGVDLLSTHGHSYFKPGTGFLGGIAGGYKFCNNIRIEGELSYRQDRWKIRKFWGYDYYPASTFRCKVNNIALMANALYDFDVHPQWTPYLGGGIGYVHSFWKSRYKRDDVALQAIAGISYSLCPKMDIGLEYRLLCMGTCSMYNNSFIISIRKFF
jgi:opacity protein-like surface antigen